jgi:hypothetical protein
MRRFLLAGVREPVAMAAGKQATGARGARSTPRLRRPNTQTGPLAAEAAWCPHDGDALLHIAPVFTIGEASIFHVALGLNVDRCHPFTVSGPSPREPPCRPHITAPMPIQHTARSGAFMRVRRDRIDCWANVEMDRQCPPRSMGRLAHVRSCRASSP